MAAPDLSLGSGDGGPGRGMGPVNQHRKTAEFVPDFLSSFWTDQAVLAPFQLSGTSCWAPTHLLSHSGSETGFLVCHMPPYIREPVSTCWKEVAVLSQTSVRV